MSDYETELSSLHFCSDSARREIEILREDKARLDFLGRAPDRFRFFVYPGIQPETGDWTVVHIVEHYTNDVSGFSTLREAIDAARSAWRELT